MTIYIDNMNTKFGRMIMNHMISDTSLEELHDMAQKLGINRKWFQNSNRHPHYDICLSKKKLAIEKFGVQEIDSKTMIEILNNVQYLKDKGE